MEYVIEWKNSKTGETGRGESMTYTVAEREISRLEATQTEPITYVIVMVAPKSEKNGTE